MFVSCDKCKYDSKDYETMLELTEKIIKDGGKMIQTKQGWIIKCPNDCSDDSIHLD